MLTQIRQTGRLPLTLLLAGMSLFCFMLSIVRLYVSHQGTFLFLNWNLFLAFVPWVVSTIIILNRNYSRNKGALLLLLLVWLLFFPNSPYILTDLFHLKWRTEIPIWFDLLLILSFAWTGLAYGFVSLLDVSALLANFFNKTIVRFTIVALLFVAGFGVYLGRFLRWNSWDVVNQPVNLLHDVVDRFLNPLAHSRTWGVTILMGVLLNMMFWTVKFMVHNKRSDTF